MTIRNMLMMLLLVLLIVPSEEDELSSWTLVADPVHNHSWWMKGMPMKGQQVIWELKEAEQQKTMKIKLFQNETSAKYIELEIKFNSTEEFNVESYDAQVVVTFSYFQMSRLAKRYQNTFVKRDVLIDKGNLVLNGKDFYFSIKLGAPYAVNFIVIFVLMAIILLKTQLTSQFRGNFTGPAIILPGVFIFNLIFPKGSLASFDDIIFNSPWTYSAMVVNTISFYIWFPYAVSLYKMFFKATLFRWRDQFWKTAMLSLATTVFTCYGVFWEFNEVTMLLVLAVQMALPKKEGEKDENHLWLKIIFLVDVAIVIYLIYWPIYPGRLLFIHSYWKIGIFAILAMEGFRCFLGKSKNLDNSIPIVAKKTKKTAKKE